MSLFLCLAVPSAVANQLKSAFDSRVYQEDASMMPIGEATCGKQRNWTATLLQVRSDATSLAPRGIKKPSHNNDHTALLTSGIAALLQREDCSSTTFLLHYMKGWPSIEQVTVVREEHMFLSALPDLLYAWEENVRYRVFPQKI